MKTEIEMRKDGEWGSIGSLSKTRKRIFDSLLYTKAAAALFYTSYCLYALMELNAYAITLIRVSIWIIGG